MGQILRKLAAYPRQNGCTSPAEYATASVGPPAGRRPPHSQLRELGAARHRRRSVGHAPGVGGPRRVALGDKDDQIDVPARSRHG